MDKLDSEGVIKEVKAVLIMNPLRKTKPKESYPEKQRVAPTGKKQGSRLLGYRIEYCWRNPLQKECRY